MERMEPGDRRSAMATSGKGCTAIKSSNLCCARSGHWQYLRLPITPAWRAKREQASLGLPETFTNFVTSTRNSWPESCPRGCTRWAFKWILTSSRASFGQRNVRRLLPVCSSSIMQTLSAETSEGSPCLYMAAARESIAFVKTLFVGFTNSDRFRSMEGRIRRAWDAVGRYRDQA